MTSATLNQLDVLVVDDDPEVLDLVSLYLETRGHFVSACGSGPEGLEKILDHEYDLVISDVHMAGVNGFELLKVTRQRYPDIGFVLMTAYEECYPLSEALGAGADGYISKPFSLQKFSLIFERAYWEALKRHDWWDSRAARSDEAAPRPFGF